MKKSYVFLLAVCIMIISSVLAGCGGKSGSIPGLPSGGSSVEKKLSDIAPYVQVTNTFNSSQVTFDYAYAPSLAKMKSGQQMNDVSVPNYSALATSLERTKKASSGFADIDQSRDAVDAVLTKMVPLVSDMTSYYKAKTYTTDNYAKGGEYIKQYLALESEFSAAYGNFNALIRQHNNELRAEQLAEFKKAGKVNAVAFMEINDSLRDVLDIAANPNGDKNAIEPKLQSISTAVTSLNVAGEEASNINSYKSKVNDTIGKVRSFLSKPDDNRAYNDMISTYNSFISAANNVNRQKLDAK